MSRADMILGYPCTESVCMPVPHLSAEIAGHKVLAINKRMDLFRQAVAEATEALKVDAPPEGVVETALRDFGPLESARAYRFLLEILTGEAKLSMCSMLVKFM